MSSSSSTTSTRGSRVNPLMERRERIGAPFPQDEAAPRRRLTLPMPQQPKRRKPPARNKRKKSKGLHLEQRHFDLIGLALVALAVFLGFVLYRDRDGGEAG